MEIDLNTLEARVRYKILVALVTPRPIALVSTLSANGTPNCAPISFFNILGEEPPLCVLSFNRRSDGELKHTVKNIIRTGEYVVNLVDEPIANAMHACGAELDEDQSEFALSGLTAVPSTRVAHPRVAEAPASLECRLWRRIEVDQAREIILGEIVHLQLREGLLDTTTMRIAESYLPVARMHGAGYATTRQRFTLPGALPE